MSNTSAQQNDLMAQEKRCVQCGKSFIIRRDDSMIPLRAPLTSTCYECQRAEQERQQKEKEERENQLWQQMQAENYQAYLKLLPQWNVVPKDSIQPADDQVLYIIGNGFDLMHCVRSSYGAFRKSLGKDNSLLFALESYWDPDALWADFENELARFNAKAMGNASTVDTFLDLFEAYDEDAGAAEFYMAAEAAANPIATVAYELPQQFRRWVESLAIGTDDRPLQTLFRKGKVLCFNYTEFVETLYGVPMERVCYIHGCRRRRRNRPLEELILGHQPGASDGAFQFDDEMPRWVKQPYKRYLVESAQDAALQIISDCDDSLTKHSPEIIAKHHKFFESLGKVKDIVVIGHSLSPVDWDYFEAVCAGLHDRAAVHWYVGCHTLRDLQNLEMLTEKLNIPRSSISVFRTDTISVTPFADNSPPVSRAPRVKVSQKYSADRQWMARHAGGKLQVIDAHAHIIDYETSIPDTISKVYFTPSCQHLFVIIRGYESGVLLFSCVDGHWRFVDELKGIPNQGLLNRRLNQVLLKEQEIKFVYNSRVRVYDLRDGRLVKNQQIRHAKDFAHAGTDVSRWFIPKKR